MKKVMKTVFKLAIILALAGCSREDLSEVQFNRQNKQNLQEWVIFQNWEEFDEVYDELSYAESDDERLAWIFEQGHPSFALSEVAFDDNYEVLSPALKTILNKDLVFQVDNQLIRYSDAKFYSLKADEFVTKSKISELASWTQVGTASIKIVDSGPSGGELQEDRTKIIAKEDFFDIRSDIVLGTSSSGAAQQWKDFWRTRYMDCATNTQVLGPSNKQMRYFHQLISREYDFGRPNLRTSQLFLQFKLYWRNSEDRLRYAEVEEMNYLIDLVGNIRFGGNFIYQTTYSLPVNIYKNLRCIKYPKWYDYPLATSDYVKDLGYTPKWYVDVTGALEHHINGDVSSAKWRADITWGSDLPTSGGGGSGGSNPRDGGGNQY